MKVQRVYVDTSVIGGCFDEEFALWSKGLMQDFLHGIFKPVLSEIVAAEIAPAPEQVRAQYAELLALQPQFAELTDEVHQLAAAYEARRILPAKFSNDALHIALATVAEVDMLVSWNFNTSCNLIRSACSMPSIRNAATRPSKFIRRER